MGWMRRRMADGDRVREEGADRERGENVCVEASEKKDKMTVGCE